MSTQLCRTGHSFRPSFRDSHDEWAFYCVHLSRHGTCPCSYLCESLELRIATVRLSFRQHEHGLRVNSRRRSCEVIKTKHTFVSHCRLAELSFLCLCRCRRILNPFIRSVFTAHPTQHGRFANDFGKDCASLRPWALNWKGLNYIILMFNINTNSERSGKRN